MIKNLAESYMRRCFELANKANSLVQTNPNVGCVIVHKNRIIGEGYHEKYGEAHAEINAFRSVKLSDHKKLPNSCLYVSLEPCNHYGKTGPCVQAIIDHKIKKVVISCLDPSPQMQGKSILILKDQGIEVTSGVLEEEGKRVLARYVTNQLEKRPFILIKYAESMDHYLGRSGETVKISNTTSDFLVHKLRTKNSAVMIGTETAVVDNPKLTSRIGGEPSPLRVILDRNERIPKTHYVLCDDKPSLIVSSKPKYELSTKSKELLLVDDNNWNLGLIFNLLYTRGISSVLVEGGSKLLMSCIHDGLWDEACVIRSQIKLSSGIKSPSFKAKLYDTYHLGSDQIFIVYNSERNN